MKPGTSVFSLLVVGLLARCALAETTESDTHFAVAIRYWGGPTVTIETWFHPSFAYDATREVLRAQPELRFSGSQPTRDTLAYDDELRQLYRERQPAPPPRGPDKFARRLDWMQSEQHHARSTLGPEDAKQTLIDGVNIIHWADLSPAEPGDPRGGDAPIDVLMLPIDDPSPATIAAALKTVAALQPRFVLPVGAPDASVAEATTAIDAFLKLSKQQLAVVDVPHNTFAVRGGAARDAERSTVLHLAPTPWQPADELAGLLDRMDAACRNSQEVFVPLSVEQMNFRPANGTHTPRWNVEHMLGRQLGFFSQIYAARQPDAFALIDLNPAQMPADYQAAHSDWTGADEAHQMHRANAYVRRFAYLLDDLPLDERAPDSFWTPRRLLAQMERHFNEHTANVVAKFELPDWPN